MTELELLMAHGGAPSAVCACDATIQAASSRAHDVERAVKAHNRTRRHVAWRAQRERETMRRRTAAPLEGPTREPALVSSP